MLLSPPIICWNPSCTSATLRWRAISHHPDRLLLCSHHHQLISPCSDRSWLRLSVCCSCVRPPRGPVWTIINKWQSHSQGAHALLIFQTVESSLLFHTFRRGVYLLWVFGTAIKLFEETMEAARCIHEASFQYLSKTNRRMLQQKPQESEHHSSFFNNRYKMQQLVVLQWFFISAFFRILLAWHFIFRVWQRDKICKNKNGAINEVIHFSPVKLMNDLKNLKHIKLTKYLVYDFFMTRYIVTHSS